MSGYRCASTQAILELFEYNAAIQTPARLMIDAALNRATFGEMKAMMKSVCGKANLDDVVESKSLTRDVFRNKVILWKKERFAICKSEELSDQYEKEKDTSEIR